MTNHFKMANVLLQNVLESDGKLGFSPELSLPCQKDFVQSLRTYQKIPEYQSTVNQLYFAAIYIRDFVWPIESLSFLA